MAHPRTPAPTYPIGGRFSLPELGLVVGLHVALLVALLALDIVPLPLPATLSVRIIEPEAPRLDAPQPPITPPKPRPLAHAAPQARPQPQQAAPAPLLAAEAPAAAQEPVQAPIAAEPRAPELPAPAPSAPAAAPAVVAEPRFDAAYLDNPAPAYPALSRRMGEEGKVVLRVFVEASGRPSQVTVSASSGHPRLDDAALAAVSRWKFIPAQRGGEAVAAWVLVPIAFNLKN